jgi:hypothetical protein
MHQASPPIAAQAPVAPQPLAVQGAAQVPPVQPVGVLLVLPPLLPLEVLAVSAKQTPLSHSQSCPQAPPRATLAMARCAEASPRQPAIPGASRSTSACAQAAAFEEEV